MKRSRILIILALILALITTFFLYRYIESLRVEPEVTVEYGSVVVAATNIPEHVKITEEMLLVKELPVEAIHPNAARSTADLVGFTTTMNILADEQILKSKIAADDVQSGLSYQIPENMRAIVIPTSEVSGLAGYLQIGDKVDMLVTYNNQTEPGQHPGITTPVETTPDEEEPDPEEPVEPTPPEEIEEYIETITQMQNVEILAIGIKPQMSEDGSIAQNAGVPSSVTLLVTPEQAEVVTYILNTATFQLTLRNPVDGVEVPLSHYGTDNFNDWRNR